ncbi:MAG: alpha/beta fold hydrolase [Alphaproteobacteria bacterium]
MRTLVVTVWALIAAACSGTPALRTESAQPPALTVTPSTFTARDGTKVEAELGKFQVPENRKNPASRKITIAFVRFPSTSAHPGNPIVYLAGGPGGSGVGTAQGARFSLFMKLREVADVIALDQRGTNLSNDLPACHPANAPTPDQPAIRANIVSYYRTGIAGCFDWWKKQGFDIDGYTTVQSADDIEDLRRALGVAKVNLWGISYGSHLGLAMMKYHSGSIGRAVLAGIEGLDETVKMPADTDAYFARLQAVIDSEPKAKAAYPDLAALMRRVHAKLNATPVHGTFTPKGADKPVTVTFDGFAVQLITSGSNADPSAIARLPQLYLALDNGINGPTAQILYDQFLASPPVFYGMPEAMDLASGVSPPRLAEIERQAKTGVLGDALNFPMPQVADIRPGIDLGESFRAPFSSPVPTLFISGTLDGRTSPYAAKVIAARFSKGQRLIVENGGHNIYEADPRIADAVLAWFRGQPVAATVHFDPPVIR